MGDVLTIIGIWYLIGLCFLVSLDVATGRIRRRLLDSAANAQEKLYNTGSFVGKRTAILITVALVWSLWPLVLWSAATTITGSKHK